MPCLSQIATRVPDVFMVPFPSSAQSLLSIFEVFNLNISGLSLPLSCIGLGTYWERLFFTLVFPLVIAAGIVVCSLVFAMCKNVRNGGMLAVAKEGAIQALADDRKSPLRVAGLIALPNLLKLSFLVFPMVTSTTIGQARVKDDPQPASYQLPLSGELRCIPSVCMRRV